MTLDNPSISIDLMGKICTTYLFLTVEEGNIFKATCDDNVGYFIVWHKSRAGVASQWLEIDDQNMPVLPENLPYQPLLFSVSDGIL